MSNEIEKIGIRLYEIDNEIYYGGSGDVNEIEDKFGTIINEAKELKREYKRLTGYDFKFIRFNGYSKSGIL